MQLSEIVTLISQRLSSKRAGSVLVEIPPTCDDVPDCLSRIRAAIELIPDVRSRSAFVSADTARDDGHLVNSLIEEWSMNDDRLCMDAGAYGSEADPDPLRRIKHFVRVAIKSAKRPRIAFIRRFDKVFKSMSSELLATMRSLEQEGWLVTVNSSPLPYAELYRRRAREDRGFTSDYGQSQARLTVDPLEPEEARRVWVEERKLGLDDRLAEAYFSTALSLSGGLRALFCTAGEMAATNWDGKSSDIRHFRKALLRDLVASPTLDRLLAYDEPDASTKLLEAVANMHLGTATSLEVDLVASHHWQRFLLDDEKGGNEKPRLRTEVIGRRALQMLRDRSSVRQMDPTSLYMANNYQGCLKVLGENGSEHHKLLHLAATMMNLVFGDSPESLYLEPSIKWAEVRQIADTAITECSDVRGREEFRGWDRIASAHQRGVGDGTDDEMAGNMEQALVLLGIRVLAVERDRSAITAAHAAIPVIEDVLRHYTRLILKFPDTGAAFASLRREEISSWWKQPGEFIVPGATERLSGTALAVFVAAMSEKNGLPVFGDPAELSRLAGLIDQGRNRVGHRVMTPSAGLGKELAAEALHILDLLLAHGKSQFSTADLRRWLRPPSSFIDAELLAI